MLLESNQASKLLTLHQIHLFHRWFGNTPMMLEALSHAGSILDLLPNDIRPCGVVLLGGDQELNPDQLDVVNGIRKWSVVEGSPMGASGFESRDTERCNQFDSDTFRKCSHSLADRHQRPKLVT
jgi:hypothetical protein